MPDGIYPPGIFLSSKHIYNWDDAAWKAASRKISRTCRRTVHIRMPSSAHIPPLLKLPSAIHF